MARPPNNIGTTTITISTTPRIKRCLEVLVNTGYYGKNPSEAAERLLARGLEALEDKGKIKVSRAKK